MDRNLVSCINRAVNVIVALRKESVDRNKKLIDKSCKFNRSLSARRAWIEIIFLRPLVLILQSLSARRAWIEIIATDTGKIP